MFVATICKLVIVTLRHKIRSRISIIFGEDRRYGGPYAVLTYDRTRTCTRTRARTHAHAQTRMQAHARTRANRPNWNIVSHHYVA